MNFLKQGRKQQATPIVFTFTDKQSCCSINMRRSSSNTMSMYMDERNHSMNTGKCLPHGSLYAIVWCYYKHIVGVPLDDISMQLDKITVRNLQ